MIVIECRYCHSQSVVPNRRYVYCSRECRKRGSYELELQRRHREQSNPEWRARRMAHLTEYRKRPEVAARIAAQDASYRSAERRAGQAVRKRQRNRVERDMGIYRKTFGVSEADFNLMFATQGGVCAICGKPETKRDAKGRTRRLNIDHDHGSGQLRGLLCSRCNTGLGLFLEDPRLLAAAIAYIAAHVGPELQRDAAEKMEEALR